MKTKTCFCGTVFPAKYRDRDRERLFCSKACAQRAWYCSKKNLPLSPVQHRLGHGLGMDEKDLETLIAEQTRDMRNGDTYVSDGRHSIHLDAFRGRSDWTEYWLPGDSEWEDPVADAVLNGH